MNYQDYIALVHEAIAHDRHYYQEFRPKISDEAYDALVAKIKHYEKEHPEKILPTSPTQRIGERPDYDKFRQVAHSDPMLSLANTYDETEVAAFLDRMAKTLGGKRPVCCAEIKVDGLAISVIYENGSFVQAVTRGDGERGDDVTQNVAQIQSLPLSIEMPPHHRRLELRGEVYMPRAAFEAQNAKSIQAGEEPWANPRNAAAGSLKLLDSRQVAGRGLDIIFYGIVDPYAEVVQYQHEVAPFLESHQLPVVPASFFAKCDSLEEVMAFAHKIEKKRASVPFDIDGIVVKLDDIHLRKKLGSTGKAPRWAIAYKFAATRAMTRLLGITLQVGRTGTITPVAELEAVNLAGSTIRRATLHNEDEVLRKDIRIGDMVYLEKGGDVIPKVTAVELSERQADAKIWSMPVECPACGSKLTRVKGEVAWRCSNPHCHDKQLGRLIFFASKAGLDIEHLGKKVMEKLYDADLVHDFDDIYRLTHDDLMSIEGFAEKSASQLLETIHKSKECTLASLIAAIGIPHIGEQTALLLADHFHSLDKLMEASEEELESLEGVGPIVAKAIIAYAKHPDHLQTVKRLQQLGLDPKQKKSKAEDASLPLHGLSFVFTGTLETTSRSEAQDKVRELGGSCTSDLTKKTSYLVAGSEAGSKLTRAEKLGVKILTEKEWLHLIS